MIDLDEALREHGAEWAQAQRPAPELAAAIRRIPDRGRRVGAYLAVAATVLAVAVASSVWVLRDTDRSPGGVGPSDVHSAIPDPVLSRLEAVALSTAALSGDPRPTAMRAVETSRSAIPAWIVQVDGGFFCVLCSRPPGAPPARGSALTVTVDATTYQRLDFRLGRHPMRLATLGRVVDLAAANAIPPQLLKAILATRGLDHAEAVLTTLPLLHTVIKADLGVDSGVAWVIQDFGAFPNPSLGGPLPSVQGESPQPSISPTMQEVYLVGSDGAVSDHARLVQVGHGTYDLSTLGTVVTVQP